ncbi:GNAT family N-acetyltransferase [Amycolatopsis sp. NBC_00345]|uniref:GNAT family N-acetyltransferase n=1 Tax=Amycolatopsis sp. NBC_00345 TaxID=2975955 RepID=UPI002E2538E9
MTPDLLARDATEADAELLLAWRNDPRTRLASRTSDVIALEDHVRWLRGVLASPDRLLLVVEAAGEPVGTVRFDAVPFDTARFDTSQFDTSQFDAARFDRERPGEWEVSITLAPESRGRGLARAVLTKGERVLAERQDVRAILASVHRDNAASAALFERAGYRESAPAGDGFRWLRKTHT